MPQSSDSVSIPYDLVACLLLTLVAVVVSVLPAPSLVTALVGIPFLLFVPGYALTVALFPSDQTVWIGPENAEQEGLFRFDRIMLSVASSIALAVIVGVNLEFTMWPITSGTVVAGLAVLTLVAATVGVIRRLRYQAREQASWAHRSGRGESNAMLAGSNLATVAVVLAVAVSLASVAVVTGMNERGEQYTEFGLLAENEEGNLSTTGHPSNLTVGEPTELYYVVTNQEQESTNYHIVVQLQVVGPDGEVNRRIELEQFEEQLEPGESVQRQHTVVPPVRGEDLRLKYLLYRTEPPVAPSAETAYKDLHIWVDVNSQL